MWLARHRLASAVGLGLAALLAGLLLAWPGGGLEAVAPSALERPDSAAPAATLARPLWATSTALPRSAGPSPVPLYQPPRVTREEAIRHVASLPSQREPGRSLGEELPAGWTAEYRGDGTWVVRNGEPAWLYLEDTASAMPANLAAINAQGAGGGPSRR